MRNALVGVLFALLAASAAGAAESSADMQSKEAAWRLTTTVTLPQSKFDKEIARERGKFRERLLKESANKGKEMEIDALFDAVVLPVAKSRYEALLKAHAAAIAETHSQDEIEAALAFHSSETGQALKAVMNDPDLPTTLAKGLVSRLGMIDAVRFANRIKDMMEAIQTALAEKEGR